MTVPLGALEIVVSPVLVGSKRAVRFGAGPVYVSPAMFKLMKDSTPEELETLLKSIEILQLPAMPSRYDFIPMTTFPK